MIIIPLSDILTAANFKTIRDCVLADGVAAYPTDTLYGLGGNFFSTQVIARIDAMKGRSVQPYSVAVSDMNMLSLLVSEIPPLFRDRLQRLLPGKFTFLFKPHPSIDPALLKNSGKIGIRMPRLRPLLRLILRLGFPLISTSVNRSGKPPLNDPCQIAQEFPDLDLLIDGGILSPSLGSTVVNLTVSPPRILRIGDEVEKLRALKSDVNISG